MDPQLKKDMKLKSFDFALGASKQLIVLSTAIIAFTVTFSKDLFNGTTNIFALSILMASWLAFLYSIWQGVSTIMALTGSLNLGERQVEPSPEHPESTVEVSIYDTNICKPARYQFKSFLGALFLTILYAGVIMYLHETTPQQTGTEPVISNGNELRIIRHSTYVVQDSVRIDTLSVKGTEPN